MSLQCLTGQRFLIVGSGIAGLSLAFGLQKKGAQVCVVSAHTALNCKTLALRASSYAAAANLALKAQQYARDPHFALKLQAKQLYKDWLKEIELLAHRPIAFRDGPGLEVFENTQAAQKQLERIKQDPVELAKRNLPPQELAFVQNSNLHAPFVNLNLNQNHAAIIYGNEAWVNATQLLEALNHACLKLGALFYTATVNTWQEIVDLGKSFLSKTCAQDKTTHDEINVIFATGYNSHLLLGALQLAPLNQNDFLTFTKPRYSIGSTFVSAVPFSSEYILHEFHSANNNKVTFSGDLNSTYLSSSTVKIADARQISHRELQMVEEQNSHMLTIAKLTTHFPKEMATMEHQAFKKNLTEHRGLRIGFGHKELLITKLVHQSGKLPKPFANTYLCSGMHKSGFLYAPVLANCLAQLQEN